MVGEETIGQMLIMNGRIMLKKEPFRFIDQGRIEGSVHASRIKHREIENVLDEILKIFEFFEFTKTSLKINDASNVILTDRDWHSNFFKKFFFSCKSEIE